MKTHFRLYKNTSASLTSSIFDLVSGDKETKQTKGLAYIFSQYPELTFKFLNSDAIKSRILETCGINLRIQNISSLEVSAEEISTEKRRADIILKLSVSNSVRIAIIIEAKSISTNSNQQALTDQINSYLDPRSFPDLTDYTRIGVVLTRYSHSLTNLVSITWDEIIQLLHDFCRKRNSNELVVQYYNFLTRISNTMKYYEKEVLSLPAGDSLSKVERFKVYVCPNTPSYNYKKPIFVTFRQSGGGVMSRLYKIEDIIIFNPTKQDELQAFRNSTYSESYKSRILEYLQNNQYAGSIPYDERFYILSETETIELIQRPHPRKNNAKFTYYSLAHILTSEIVTPESQTTSAT